MTKKQDGFEMLTLRIEEEWANRIEEYRQSLRSTAGFLPRAVVIRMLLAKGLAAVKNGDDVFRVGETNDQS